MARPCASASSLRPDRIELWWSDWSSWLWHRSISSVACLHGDPVGEVFVVRLDGGEGASGVCWLGTVLGPGWVVLALPLELLVSSLSQPLALSLFVVPLPPLLVFKLLSLLVTHSLLLSVTSLLLLQLSLLPLVLDEVHVL